MTKLAKQYAKAPAIREQALSLTRHLPEKSALSEIEALFVFVRDEVRYIKDVYGVETLSTPERLLKDMQGDCDDKSTLLGSLLLSIGYPVRFVAMSPDNQNYTHVFPQVKLGRKWLTLETTMPWPVGKMPPNIAGVMIAHV